MQTQNIVVSTDNNIRTPDVIETDKKYVIDSYQSAISSNYTKFKRGDERATSEYIYKNQADDAKKIVEEIYLNNRRVTSITKTNWVTYKAQGNVILKSLTIKFRFRLCLQFLLITI
jgi:Na+-transporting NADH:ubiquinone oxidoreductase subunit NqrA